MNDWVNKKSISIWSENGTYYNVSDTGNIYEDLSEKYCCLENYSYLNHDENCYVYQYNISNDTLCKVYLSSDNNVQRIDVAGRQYEYNDGTWKCIYSYNLSGVTHTETYYPWEEILPGGISDSDFEIPANNFLTFTSWAEYTEYTS
ncbi:MAG: hypothetical protein NC078_03895 [Ruminococcus sp.]|nr:hypothetical protein [Ruminococcus sp.]